MGDSLLGQGASLVPWPKGRDPLTGLVDGLVTVARWLGSILMIPVVLVAFAVLMVDQRYRRGRSWGSILGTRPDA